MVTSIYDNIRQFLQKNKNPARGIKEKAYLKTEEECLGIPRGVIRTYIKKMIRNGGHLTINELKKLWSTHIVDARFAAIVYAEARPDLWDEKWLNLFLSWAQAKDTGWHNTDILGPHLIGTAYMSGLCPREKLLKLKNSGFLWTWRTGMTALIPSLKTSNRDWALLCKFAADCVKPGSKFHRQYFALKGLSMTMRWAIGTNKDRVLSFLTDNEMYLSKTFVTEVRNKATIGRKR
jgi:3-methyladenine DNA glycosylase AlkD